MIRALSVAAMLAIGVTVAFAQSAVVSQRQDAMKALSNATKAPGAMLKGEASFDLAKVKATLTTYREELTKLKGLWPDDSKSGDTYALPAVWEKKPEFIALIDKFLAETEAASSKIADEATLKAEWPKLMRNCGGCHKEYRKPS